MRRRGRCERRVAHVPQQSVAQTLVRNRSELLLDRLHDGTRSDATGEGVAHVDGFEFESDGVDAGEPADRTGQIGPWGQRLLAPVTLESDQNRRRPCTPLFTPAGHREGECGEENIVDTGVEGSGDRRRHGLGRGLVHLDVDLAHSRCQVHRRVEGARTDGHLDPIQNRSPVGQFGSTKVGTGVVDQRVRPSPERRADRIECRYGPRRHLQPGRDEIGNDDAPGHAVDDEVVSSDDEPARLVGSFSRR